MGGRSAQLLILSLLVGMAPGFLCAQGDGQEGTGAEPKPSFFVVEIAEFNKTVTCDVLSSADLKMLERDVSLEKTLAPKALKAADVEWKKLYKKTFPKSLINPFRTVSKVGQPYTDRQLADYKKADLMEDLKWKMQDKHSRDHRRVNDLRNSLKNVSDKNEIRRINERIRDEEKNLADKERDAKRAADVYTIQINRLVTAELDRLQKSAEAESSGESGSGN